MAFSCCNRRGTRIEGYAPRPGESTETNWNIVGTEYFQTLRIPIVQGRSFAEADRPGAPLVAIVNQAFARRYWPGQDPLGKRVRLSGPEGPATEVVGVARDGKYRSLGEDPLPFLYVPAAQEYRGAMILEARTSGDPAALIPILRAEVRALAPSLPIIRPTTLRDALGVALLPQRLGALLLGALGALAALLAALGLYGVLAYSVAQRTREFGVRIALGASPAGLVGMVLRRLLKLALVASMLGVVLAIGASRLLQSALEVFDAYDPGGYAIGLAVVLGSCLVAAYVPARRAGRADPVVALRAD